MRIRKYRDGDRESVEHIHFETGFLGKPMSEWLSSKRIWRRGIQKYLNCHQEYIFVLEDEKSEEIVGYVLGCVDDKNESLLREGGNVLITLISGAFAKKKDRLFWKSQRRYLRQIISGESGELRYLKVPKGAGHIHINILPEHRGKKWGSKLLKAFEKQAKRKGAKSIYANSFKTSLNKNTNFWLRNGFKRYSEAKSTHWMQQLPEEDMSIVCYVKQI